MYIYKKEIVRRKCICRKIEKIKDLKIQENTCEKSKTIIILNV